MARRGLPTATGLCGQTVPPLFRAMRVLIVRLGAFGDILHTLPLAADLAAAGHQVGWLCEDRWLPVIDGSPALRWLHGLPRRALKGGPDWPWQRRSTALRQVVRGLRRQHYDVVIDAQGLAKSAVLATMSGAARRISHRRPRAREGAWLLSHARTPVGADHVIDQQRALGLPLTKGRISGPWQFPLPAWEAEHAAGERWLHAQGLVRPWMLNVGAGWPTKVWPRERQIAFVRAAFDRLQRSVVLVWGNGEEEALARDIAQQAGGAIVAPRTTIPELAGLIAHAGVMISGDTGPLHLALALGTPAVGLFGPVPATRNGPRGCGYRTFQAPGAAWERRDVSKVDLGAIAAGSVVEAAAAAAAEGSGR